MAAGEGPGGINAYQPVGLRPGFGGRRQVVQFFTYAEVTKGFFDGRRRGLREPEALDGFLPFAPGVYSAKDEFPFPAGVASVHHGAYVRRLYQALDDSQLFPAAADRFEGKLPGDKGQLLQGPFFKSWVVVLWFGQF
ncbi:hypothetical protein MTHERMOG20_23550 [Moorella thermoacetica]|nr:hypothetical protein MTHERMOG20_23550 [Moorella thermoacetica]